MAPPVVQYVADSEGDNATPEGLVESMQQQEDAGAASESVALKDGRRRSSRLRGKGALESPPVVVKKGATESSSRRGRRKKGVTVESVQGAVVKVESVQDAVVRLERVQDVKVEAPAAAAAVRPQGLLPEETVEGDESGANPAAAAGDAGALASISVSPHVDEKETVKTEDAVGGDGALVRHCVSQQDDIEELAVKSEDAGGDDGALVRVSVSQQDDVEKLAVKTDESSGDGCASVSPSPHVDERLTEDDSGDGALVRCASASVSRDVDEELTEKIEDDLGDGALVHCASASVSRDVDEELTVKTIELGDGALVHCASASVSRDVDEVLTVETEDGMGDGALARCASAHVDEGLTVKTEELGGGALVRCTPASISRDVDEGLTVETEDDMGDGALARCASAHFDEGLTVKTEELGDEALVPCGSPHANGDEKLDELFLVDDEDGEGKAPLMDAKGDFCDSNIFGDLQSIVNLHPVENGILRMEVPSSSKGEDKVEAKERANVGPAPADEVTTLITVQASCETTTKDIVSETEPVVSDPQEEEGASRGSTSKAEDCEDSQGLASASEGKKKEYSIVFEARATLKITSETSCLRSDGEGIVQLGKKSDSLKSVNQEIRVSDGDVAGTMKVESRSHSRHTGNTAGGEDDSSGVTEGDDNTNAEKVDESVSINSKAGWVKCDACNKWRSIPVELAEKIGGTNAYWSCKENPNKSFADCSIPQVKSNEEINKDLGISESSSCDEEDDAEATCDSKPTYSGRPTVTLNGQAIWKQIKRNIFKHRKQKHQDADEAMVCQCGPPKVGEAACGDDCLNRMLNVECLPQMCPCGSLCTNMQFQKREYAKVELFRCGKKGHGLQAKERISRGSFVIEYVGEVLDMPSFEGRQKEYSMNSQKHFYFMTLSANEVIDACSKGNLGRFINHSCDPNCQTEKWMVDGEVCIGLFAIRDVAKGEEITFDYNFVRVGGADAKKCECGAGKCRGFIGVDPDTPQNVLEIDSDDGEDPEPIMLQADSDEEPDEYLDKSKSVAKKARLMSGSESVYENLKSGVKRKFYSGGAKDVKYSKRSRRVKTAASSKIITHKPAPPRLFSGSRFGVRNTYYSDVESKLGELTDETGGLRKQRDVGRQYLKLLVLTAASGGNVNGAAACSARDLSMLLEALLKTQKSSSLRDIMNKNGLQMFHNLIKQVRKSFEKRPILRKLLKVLDHLAKKRVLTVELIYSAPRSGSECFTDTLFDLSRHDDTEVQNMARNFRKLYVPPRPPKPMANPERPLVKSPSQQSSVAVASPSVAGSPQVASSVSNRPEQAPGVQEETVEGDSANAPTTSRRKRPSRWDTVAETGTPASSSGVAVSAPSAGVSSEPVTSNAPLPPASSVPAARPSVPARPSGSLPPVRPHQVYQQLYPPGLQPPFPPGMQPQVYPPGPMLPGQRPDIAMAPMHFMPGASSQMHPFAVGRGHSNQVHGNTPHGATPHGAPPHVPYPMMHSMYAGAPFAAPPAPLPPSGRPSWGQHSGGFSGRALEAEASEASRGQGKRSSKEPGESDEAREPSVPGMSPAKPHKERSSSGVSGAPARPSVEVGGARAESSPKAHRGEHGSRTHGHESRSRSVADSGEPTQHGYSRPDHREGRSEKEMSWDTPECSSFHHHVSGMIRARVEKKRMVHYKDLEKFCSKLTEVVTRKEIKKYRENKKEGMQKVILRSKLLEKVDAYVDLQIEVYRKLKKGDGQS